MSISESQDNSIFVGVQREYYQSGALKSEIFVNAGKKEGEYKAYHSNGQLYNICNYINDKKEG
jgi:antitoxin component YwqK of YwqJK toxin-antitoxin module